MLLEQQPYILSEMTACWTEYNQSRGWAVGPSYEELVANWQIYGETHMAKKEEEWHRRNAESADPVITPEMLRRARGYR
jgi:hypothetical protein